MPDEVSAPLDLQQAFAGAYQELRRIAHARLYSSGGRNTVLDTTALVHETYFKLSRQSGLSLPDRPHFLVYAGKAMRSIIVDMVRQRQTERAGGDVALLTLSSTRADALPAEEAHSSACTKRCTRWPRSTRAWRRSSRCATSPA